MAVYYLVSCLVFGIGLREIAFRPQHSAIADRQLFRVTASHFGAELQDVSVTASDGVVLRAWFARPVRGNGDAVILLHGIGDNREGMTGFAELFLSKGYEVLLPDLRGHGTSGKYPTYGMKETGDVQDWYQWLIAQEELACVFGMGESMGAAIVLQSVRTTQFCAVVAESSFATFRQIAYIRVGQMFHTGSWLGRIALRPAVELSFLYAQITRQVDLTQISPQNSVAASSVPILLIHGLADDSIPASQSEMIRSHNPADVALWEVPNAGHCGAVNADPEKYNFRVLNWFSSHDAPRFHRSAQLTVGKR